MKKKYRTFALALTIIMPVFLLLAGIVLAKLVRFGGDLYWEYPDGEPGYPDCTILDPDDAKLWNRLYVTRVSDGEVVFDDAIDTGLTSPETPGTGLAIADPWTLADVETDVLEREAHQVTICRWWKIYGSCDGGEVITQTHCIVPLDVNGNPVPMDGECCWVAGTITGTKSIQICPPLILMGWEPQ